ncbi:hypothetical protein A2U01_0066591, partial [Trifolium medium]|nr:hypothetical protein [Trifolium medium]
QPSYQRSGHVPCARATTDQSGLPSSRDSQRQVDHVECSARTQTAVTPAQVDT